ncbi:MAG TPA: hypothetical protein VNH18_28925 [Bryobacteraceae bacterium]|nr:hypothetical protein [Bryobacteraceae bacterium]
MKFRSVVPSLLLIGIPVALSASAFAQDRNQEPPPPPPFSSNSDQGPYSPDDQGPPPPYQQNPRQQPDRNAPPQRDAYAPPARLTLRSGTWLPVRIDQQLSSDHNQTGENFYATLADPLIVNGVVVAHRGQTVIGRITEAQKAGRVEGTSKLGLELIAITAADGEHIDIHSRIVEHNGSTSVGRDLAGVGQATAVGAAIGGISDGGRGAGIGAGVGAAAGIAGVLLTRGRPTVVYPETLLTFELESSVDIDTDRSPGAFRYADARDFERDRSYTARRAPGPQGPPPPPYYGGYGYPYPYPPYAYGYPGYGYGSFGIIIGRGYGYGYGRYRGRR